MRQFTHQYATNHELSKWLVSSTHSDYSSTLIQIFSGILDPDIIRSVVKTILEKLPGSVIIGATTGGEILNGKMLDESIVISLSLFDQTDLKSIHLVGNDSESMGKEIADSIVGEDTKCVIMFADGLKCNGDAILRGFNKVCLNDVIIAGGMSGDNYHFEHTYCIHGADIFDNGIVAVALSNPDLEVFHTYNLSWSSIGKKMIVTKSNGNIVYEIDHKPIQDVYAKYLGEDVVQKMPGSTIEFPLIMQAGNVNIARSMIAIPEDNKGIIYAGELPEGSEVHFGIGSPSMLSESSKKNYFMARENPIEGLFIYSCIARKTFLGKDLESEFNPLATIAPVSGFFTYGEFYHGDDGNKLLNITSTILGLSETHSIKDDIPLKESDFFHSSLTIGALMHLVNVTLEENEAYAQELLKASESLALKNDALNVSANGIIITDIEGNIEWANAAYSRLTGYAPGETTGLNPRSLVNSHVQDNVFYESMWTTILSKKVWHGELINRRKDGSLYNEEMTITPMLDHNGNIDHFVAVKQDITERKQMEEQINEYAFYDILTHLPNRRLFGDRFTQAQSMSKRSSQYSAVVFLDLDNFKSLNDRYGHSSGDLLLVEVARRIKVCLRESDTVARFGGDEFAILLNGLSVNMDESILNAEVIAEKIRSTIAQPYFLTVEPELYQEKIITYNCTASIGVSLFLEYEVSQDDILKHADDAMYQAKESGRNKVLFYQTV